MRCLLSNVSISNSGSDLMVGNFVDRIALDSPDISVRIDKKGILNWTTLSAQNANATGGVETKQTALMDPSVVWSLGEFSIAGARSDCRMIRGKCRSC